MARGVFLKKNGEKYYPAPYMPIGSIYITVSNDNPSKWFGGTWEQIKDTFLLACGDTYANGATGGEATHTLKVEEMPSHNHSYNQWLFNGGSASGVHYGYGWQANTGMMFNDMPSDWGNIGNTGGNQPHNNMPPYLAVYVWKRVS